MHQQYSSNRTFDEQNPHAEFTREIMFRLDELNEKYNILCQNLKNFRTAPPQVQDKIMSESQANFAEIKSEMDKKSRFLGELESQIEQV